MSSAYSAFNILLIAVSVILLVSLTSVFLSVNTVFSVFSLILVFLSASSLMLLANYEFYAIVFTTVYVGAVSIFFIFVLMTINLRFEDTLEYYDEIYADKIFSLIFLLFFSAVCHGATFIVFGRGGAKASTDYLVSAYSEIKLTALLQRSATGVEKAVKYTEETAPADSTISFINFPV
jgi:NADH-quinone oxidoreductase subunit J